ncbi:unnamed protein product [Prorocentrum cordatum]|uniref:Uncharacterized protein n=1 Tax=Prorocentrum cordatum TaxID=2364126 RepID=A0ABN9TEE6_9DINO|nr:unnamed protein product [Polarella glacialis]
MDVNFRRGPRGFLLDLRLAPLAAPPGSPQVLLRTPGRGVQPWKVYVCAVCLASTIDELKQTVENAVGENKEKLLAELDKLEKAYPAAAELKEKFLDQWDKIVEAVNLDEVKKQVAECTEDVTSCAQDKLKEVQGKMEDALKAHGVTLDGIKKQAEEFWSKFQLELPDMDDLKSSVAEYGDQAKAAWEEFKESHDISSLADAAGSIINNAFGTVSGWFR